jgi:hypothetical protein
MMPTGAALSDSLRRPEATFLTEGARPKRAAARQAVVEATMICGTARRAREGASRLAVLAVVAGTAGARACESIPCGSGRTRLVEEPMKAPSARTTTDFLEATCGAEARPS